MPDWIVFTDLDGTLLDHNTYRWDPARPALERLRREKIPLVLVSSKTRPEIEAFRAEMGIDDPFIPENGGAIFVPDDYPLEVPRADGRYPGYRVLLLGRPIAEIAPAFDRLAERFPSRALTRMSPEAVRDLTGLSLEQARGAISREFGEAFIPDDPSTPAPDLAAAAESLGLRLTRGGRFYHLLGENDKGRAVRVLIDLFKKDHPGLISIGIGDAQNDQPLLAEVDRPFLVARPQGGHHAVHVPRLVRLEEPGPAGWNRAINDLLDSAE